MDSTILLASAGWILALTQFIFTLRITLRKNEDELLEKTLGYFERGMLARTIGISLVEGIWLKKKKNLDIIVPVLNSQLRFLLTEAENYEPEERNAIRLFFLLEKCLPFAADSLLEIAEAQESIMSGARSQKKGVLGPITLKAWYERLGGDGEMFDAETKKTPR